MKKVLGPLLGLLLLAGIGAAVIYSANEQSLSRSTVEVSGLIGSEKRDFFDDLRVQERLKALGLIVKYRKAGSRQIGTSFNLGEYDFAFPAGLPAAELILRNYKQGKSFSPFFSPMAVATWRPIADVLVSNAMAKKHDGYYTLDMGAYMRALGQDMRWRDLKDNKVFAVNKFLLINTTDIRKSNSAAMYLALASYVLNDSQVVQDDAQMQRVLPKAIELFKRLGYVESSSAAPFENFLIMGMGKTPMVMIYEQQFIQQASLRDGSITKDMVLMYPEPSLYTKHTLIGLSEGGNRLGEVLESDPRLLELAIEHGLRNANTAYFREFVKSHDISVAPTLVNVVDPPSYEVLENMIQAIEKSY